MTDLPPPPVNWQPTPPAEPAKAKPTWRKERTRKQKIAGNLFLVFAVLIILLGIATVLSPAPPEKHAKWQASIKWDVSEMVDPATIKVWVTTRNVGQATAVPDCAVSLNSPNGSYSGYEIFTIDRLAPGHEQTWNGLVTISGEGARYVTRADSRVTCTDTAG
jgi:hypothetical protein